MHIAYITGIRLRLDKSRHTVAQAEFGAELTGLPRSSIENNFKSAVAPTVEECVVLLAAEIRAGYRSSLQRLNLDAADLAFDIGYSEVTDGLFWPRGMLNGRSFRVSDGAHIPRC